MRFIYSSQCKLRVFPSPRTLAAAAQARFHHTGVVTGFAVWASGSLTVKATLAGVEVYASALLAVDGVMLVDCGSVTADEWQIVAGASAVTIGTLYPGTLITVQAPSKPFAFELSHEASDKSGLGGAPSSTVHNALRRGLWGWQYIHKDEINAAWRAFRSASQGGRIPHVAELPDTLEPVIITSPMTQFPFQNEIGVYWSGEFEVGELP